jgi:hypothetical protein
VRAGLAATTIAVLVAALLAGGREPSADILATAPLSGQDPGAAGAPPTQPPVQLPDPSGPAVQAPASSSKPISLTSLPSAEGIPAVALAAYQRSAAVMDTADPSCHLDWSLLAAIGQVESDQGRVGGSSLDQNGIAHPRIIGPRLDGKHGTSLVRDTDAGRLDGDRQFDHAVGPMQFLPSTWAAVAVDGDGDGRRDVQDINDASLGSAVYLCADHDDLATRAGSRAALMRYNHSRAYVDGVMAIAHDFATSSVPSSELAARPVSFTDPGDDQHAHLHPGRHGRHHHHRPPTDPPSPGPVTTDPVPPTPAPTPTPTPPTPTPPTPTPDPGPPPGPGGPTDPGTPGGPTEPPVIPVPLPAELADFTPQQVAAYDVAWAVCDDDLTAGWSTDPDATAALTQCLATEVDVAVDDPDLLVFVDWLETTQDPAADQGAQ